MEIAYLIIGLLALWILRAIAENQKVQCRNQVKIAKLLNELVDKVSKEERT